MYKIIKVNDQKVIEQAVEALEQGKMIVYPTETCYGLGVDATNQKAVERLLKYKARREGKPLSIAVFDRKMAETYAEMNETAENLFDNYFPGPLTIVLKGKSAVANGIESEYGTIGIRIPDYRLILDIIKQFKKPITATSANVSYQPHPYSVKKLLKNLPKKQKEMIDLIIDAGELPRNEVSTVVDTTLNSVNVLRKGQVAFGKKGDPVMQAHTKSTSETKDFGSMLMLKYIDELEKSPIVFALGGELGTGKTQLAKGIARQLGITQTIKSPTFNLILEYPFDSSGREGTLVHIDTWRLASIEEFASLEIENYIEKGNVIVIEWADKFFNKIPERVDPNKSTLIKIQLTRLSENERNLTVEQLP